MVFLSSLKKYEASSLNHDHALLSVCLPLGHTGERGIIIIIIIINTTTTAPVPVAARSKAQVFGRSPAEIVGSNPTGGMDVCLLWVLCVAR